MLIGVPGSGILRSTDAGATFVDVSAGLDSADVRAIVLDASGNAFAGLFGSIYGGGWAGFRLASAGRRGCHGTRQEPAAALRWAAVLLRHWRSIDGAAGGDLERDRRRSGQDLLEQLVGRGGTIRQILRRVGSSTSNPLPMTALFRRVKASGGTRALGFGAPSIMARRVAEINGPPNSEVLQTTFAIGSFPGNTTAVIAQRGAGLFFTANITGDTHGSALRALPPIAR